MNDDSTYLDTQKFRTSKFLVHNKKISVTKKKFGNNISVEFLEKRSH